MDSNKVMTVKGPIEASELGLTLPHEHVMVDFIGAEKSGTHRYDQNKVVETMRPYLEEIASIGVRTLVECTPMYLARDVAVLDRLSTLAGIHIVTNTGQYKEPFLPSSTFELSEEKIAESWIDEFENGIDGTKIRPGFIKTAVSSGPLEPVQRKVIGAAALTSAQTGLPIATHTGTADAAEEILDILEKHNVDPERWIFVHAQNEENQERLSAIAERGAWVELDGLNRDSEETHLAALLELMSAGFENRVLLSHDSGWYNVGEPGGGEIRGFTFLFDSFVPTMRSSGVGDESIRRICAENPSRAFSLRG